MGSTASYSYHDVAHCARMNVFVMKQKLVTGGILVYGKHGLLLAPALRCKGFHTIETYHIRPLGLRYNYLYFTEAGLQFIKTWLHQSPQSAGGTATKQTKATAYIG